MAIEENEEIKKTVKVLDELSLNEKERELYEAREKARLDEISMIGYATRKGKREGKLEDAKKMLEEKMSIELIIKITGLTKEEILSENSDEENI